VDSVNPHLDPGTRAALTSLTYNAGQGWGNSGLGQAIKAGDLDHAKALFLQYNESGGAVNPALTQRRLKEAEWFGRTDAPETNRTDASTLMDRIQTDPVFADRPELQKAVLQNAFGKIALQERADAMTAKAQKDQSDAAEMQVFQDIHSPTPKSTVDTIMGNPYMDKEAKERMVDQLDKATGADRADKTYGKGFYDLYKAVHAPEGDPSRITDPSQLYSHVGPNGDLTVSGVDKLVTEINGRKTPEGEAEGEMKSAFLKNARNQISGSDEGLHIKDPKGDELYLKFLAQFFPSYEAAKNQGKSAATLFNPESPDYLGKMISGFRRPMNEWYSDMMADQGGGPDQAGKFDPTKVKTVDDLVAAYHAGNVPKAQADQIAIDRGWAYRKPPPAPMPEVPMSQ
jgi:hypothetical protein